MHAVPKGLRTRKIVRIFILQRARVQVSRASIHIFTKRSLRNHFSQSFKPRGLIPKSLRHVGRAWRVSTSSSSPTSRIFVSLNLMTDHISVYPATSPFRDSNLRFGGGLSDDENTVSGSLASERETTLVVASRFSLIATESIRQSPGRLIDKCVGRVLNEINYIYKI